MSTKYNHAHFTASKIEKELRKSNFSMKDINKLTRNVKTTKSQNIMKAVQNSKPKTVVM